MTREIASGKLSPRGGLEEAGEAASGTLLRGGCLEEAALRMLARGGCQEDNPERPTEGGSLKKKEESRRW